MALDIEAIERRAQAATPGPWGACKDGQCTCGQVWFRDYPVATVIRGDWGDDYPVVEVKPGQTSFDPWTVDAKMEQITYGHMPPEKAAANATFIAHARQDIPALLAERAELIEVLRGLLWNEHVDLGDLVYQVRDREMLGWDGPSVKAWSDAVAKARAILARARGEVEPT